MATTYKITGVANNPDGSRAKSQKVVAFKTSDNSLIGQDTTDLNYGTFDIVGSVDNCYVVCLFDNETITPRIFKNIDPASYDT